MSDQFLSPRNAGDASSQIDDLIRGAAAPPSSSFSTVFRGYDRDEVDAAIAELDGRLRSQTEQLSALEQRAQFAGAAAEEKNRESIDRLRGELDAATARSRDDVERLEADLAASAARADDAERKVQALAEELMGASGESANRHHFEEVLRVAEEQASQLIKNASVQGDRLLESAREEIQSRRGEAKADADAIRAKAQHDAQQVRLRIDTELTAHQAQLEREAAHAEEKVLQAQQEAAAIRTEADKGAAALRSMVERETTLARAAAEEAVRELRMRTLEFEESLTRRQDDAQQEFLVLHNQAVSHAERITQDANEQVQSSLEHAQRVQAKADDFDRLMRAQAKQIEADANIRSREHLERSHAKAQRIIDTVTSHSQAILRDAEDRTRQLRWQQHQLTSFMAEVRELIRPDGALGVDDDLLGVQGGRPFEAEPSNGAGDDSASTDAAADGLDESHRERRADAVDADADVDSDADVDADAEAEEGDREEALSEGGPQELDEEESVTVAGDPDFVGDEPLEDEPVAGARHGG